MTAQIGDQFKFKGENYDIVAISEPLGFYPRRFGLVPEAVCSACWDGYWCVYNITKQGIFLEDLYINTKDDCYPEIEGVRPLTGKDGQFSYMGHHLYKGINLKMDYSGKILVGDKFLHEYYIHMGYQRAWAYEVLIEFVFENGNLVKTNDQSHVAAEIRGKISDDKGYEKNLLGTLPDFVYESFDLDYETKAWWL